GTRLRPLTNNKPKALVEVNGVTLLEIVIRRLRYYGFQDLIVNTHHFAQQIHDFLEARQNFGLKISISHEANQALETGGGLKKAAWFFEDGAPFLLCNTDILCDIDLRHFYQTHCEGDALATLAVRQRPTSRYLIFDEYQSLSGWLNTKTGAMKMCRPVVGNLQLLAFSGLHIIDPRLFQWFPDSEKFSIIDTYLEAAKKQLILAYRHDDSHWLDVGKPHSLEKASEIIADILI
ncbi:MAG: nucleotidyltransferase family protein, partial [Bacteroidota bacterium]